ncbi:putative RNA polymerase [Bacillus sp. TS-2]|nr:putative RNA polymerase [Bacillus sp. TS-2]
MQILSIKGTNQSKERRRKSLLMDFEETYRSFYPQIYHYCLHLVGEKWEAEELAQETFLKAGVIQDSTKAINTSYLKKIANSMWIDRWRKNSKISTVPIDQELLKQEEKEYFGELEVALTILVSSLTSRQQLLILLIDVYQFKSAEIASYLKTTEGAIKSALYRARERLKKHHFNNDNKGLDDNQALRVSTLIEIMRNQDIESLIMLAAEEDYLPLVRAKQLSKIRLNRNECQLKEEFHFKFLKIA